MKTIMDPSIQIVGASVRAAAQSAVRAGMRPVCADCFADLDLLETCHVEKIRAYPGELAEIVTRGPDVPWMYTGGLENYPDLVDEISQHRTLLGNLGAVLRPVRDPSVGLRALSAAGLGVPESRAVDHPPPTDGSWLLKSQRSSGGLGVRIYRGQRVPRTGTFFQRRVAGISCAATYVATSRQTILLGVTEQIVNQPWTGAPSFAYAGSVGPLELDNPIKAEVVQIGDVLRCQFGLRGLFGVDGILAQRRWWTIEINPRYPASVEILERAYGLSTARLHVDACSDEKTTQVTTSAAPGNFHGKAIVYATQRVAASPEFCHWTAAQNKRHQPWPRFADLPHPGAEFSQGDPVLTTFATDTSRLRVVERLTQRLLEVRCRLQPVLK